MRSWCFDSQESGGVYDREYGSADIREVVYKIVGNGLFMDTDTSLQVVADSGLTVKVQPGNCFINGAFGAVDTAESLTFDASASGRYDIVVARFDLSLSYRSIRLAVIKGTDGSATAPTPTKTASVYDLQLAKVNVRAGATSILQSDITDTRTDTTVCGVVNGVSSQAAALQSQINDMGSAKQDKTNTLATEAALDDADTVPFYDASAGAHRKTLWSNIKAKLKTYFDTLYVSGNVVNYTLSAVSPNAKLHNGIAKYYPIINKVYVRAQFELLAAANKDTGTYVGQINEVNTFNYPCLATGSGYSATSYCSPFSARIYAKYIEIMPFENLQTGSLIEVTGWFTPTTE